MPDGNYIIFCHSNFCDWLLLFVRKSEIACGTNLFLQILEKISFEVQNDRKQVVITPGEFYVCSIMAPFIFIFTQTKVMLMETFSVHQGPLHKLVFFLYATQESSFLPSMFNNIDRTLI